MTEDEIDANEAVRRLARVLYQEIQRPTESELAWDDLPRERKIDIYDTILVLSDQEIYWRILFDNPDTDCVSGGVVDQDPKP